MKPIHAVKRLVPLTLVAVATILAQTPAAKKPLTFNGKVEAVRSDPVCTVAGETVVWSATVQPCVPG